MRGQGTEQLLAGRHRRISVAVVLAVVATSLTSGEALSAPGDLEPSFGGDGRVVTNVQGAGIARAVLVQSDDKIVAGGSFRLVRYLPGGGLDDDFGDGGVVLGSPEDILQHREPSLSDILGRTGYGDEA